MKLTAIALTLGLATAPAAFAEQKAPEPKPAPKAMKMTDAQLDHVTAGLITVVVVDVIDIRDTQVAVGIPVNAGVAVQVLGGQLDQTVTQRPGRIVQQQ